MMTVHPYINMPEVLPHHEVESWITKHRSFWLQASCPSEVREFIEEMTTRLDLFKPFRRETAMMSGKEMLLCGIKEVKGERVLAFASYPIEIPVLHLVDRYSTMMRLFKRKGKQGLIDYTKAEVKGTELERVLHILNVEVFHHQSAEFRQVMQQIKETKYMAA